MRRVNVVAVAATAALGLLAGSALPAGAQMPHSKARMIVGDGSASRPRPWSSRARGSCRPDRPPMSASRTAPRA